MNRKMQITKRTIPYFSFILLILILLSSVTHAQSDSIADIQGNKYKIIKIGDQWWMAENLRVNQYANGEEIPHLTDNVEWTNTSGGAFCYYNNNPENLETYGNLYNWHTVNDERGICPEGWHVATDREWMTLEKYLGMSAAEAGRMTAWRGTDEGDKLKHESFGGNNSSGFSVLGSGYRDPQGIYKAQGTDSDFWTSTAYSNNGNIEGILHGFLNTRSSVVRNFHVTGYGFCVRCVKDNTTGISIQPVTKDPTVYPNPAGEQINISHLAGETLTIRNILGQTMLYAAITGPVHRVDVSGLDPGAYFLTINGGKDVQAMKFIKE